MRQHCYLQQEHKKNNLPRRRNNKSDHEVIRYLSKKNIRQNNSADTFGERCVCCGDQRNTYYHIS